MDTHAILRRLALAAALLLAPTVAFAQCNGVFPANTICGTGNSQGIPGPISLSAASVTGPATSVVGDIATWNNTIGSKLADTPPLQIFGTQTANTFLSGPSTGSAAFPTYRAIVGADLPNPGASSLGGVESSTAPSNEFATGVSTGGSVTYAQPSLSNLSGWGTNVLSAAGNALNGSGGLIGFSGALGTPTSGTLTNATGLPISTGLSGAGTGVLSALGQNTNASSGVIVPSGLSSGTCNTAIGLNSGGTPVLISCPGAAVSIQAGSGGTGLTGTLVAGGCLYNNGGTIYTQPCGNILPQGRLTLTSGTPVLAADVTAATTIYYDCYNGGRLVSVYNGTQDVQYPIGSCEISVALESSGTGEVLSAGVFDIWAVNVSNTLTLCIATNGSGGGWASDSGGSNSARGTGYSQLDLTTRSFITNKNSITDCYNGATNEGAISANQATYLGTFYTTANGQTAMQFKPSAASGGSANVLGLYNGYNRTLVTTLVRSSTSTWTTSSTTPIAMGGGTSFRVTFVDGLQESQIGGNTTIFAANNSSGAGCIAGLSLDSTTATPAVDAVANSVTSGGGAGGSAADTFYPQLGQHYISAVEFTTSSGTCTYFGAAGAGGSITFFSLQLSM